MASQESSASGDGNSQPTKTTPKDALVMASILREMGVSEFEPRIINQMVEFAYRYITDTVEDGRVYAAHANRKTLNLDDIKLSVSQKLDHSFTAPPPREFLLDIARSKNSLPLPLIPDRSGVRLPPERYCLTSNNYRVKSQTKKSQQRKQSGSGGKASSKASSASSINNASKLTNPTQQIMGQQQQQQQQNMVRAAVRPPAQNQQLGMMNQSQPRPPSFPSMLKRKHEGDDDYDT